MFAAIMTVPRLATHRADNPAQPARSAEADVPSPRSSGAAKPETKATAPIDKRPAKRASATSAAVASRSAAKAAMATKNESLTPASAKEAATTKAAPAASSDASAGPAAPRVDASKGEVLDQVMPEVSAKARATIHGHVRVAVKVRVDAAGAVSDATLDSGGPSAFFADAALKAAHKWAFTPPEVNGKSVASEWLLHFVFTSADTQVTPRQVAP